MEFGRIGIRNTEFDSQTGSPYSHEKREKINPGYKPLESDMHCNGYCKHSVCQCQVCPFQIAFFSSFFLGGKGLKNYWDRIITKLYHRLTSMASYDIVGLYLTTFWIWLKFIASLSIDSIPKKEVWWYHHTDLHKPTMAHKCHTRYFYHRSSYFHNMSLYYQPTHAIIRKTHPIIYRY